MPVGAVIFTKELGLIGCTSQARPLLAGASQETPEINL